MMDKISKFFPKLKGIKLNQKYIEDTNVNLLEITILIQSFECDLNEFMLKLSKNYQNVFNLDNINMNLDFLNMLPTIIIKKSIFLDLK